MTISKSIIAGALLGIFTVSANGGEIRKCGYEVDFRNIVVPSIDTPRYFASEEIGIWHVNTGGEPVCCSSHVVIISPNPNSDTGGNQCRLLSNNDSNGFSDLSVKDTKASYNAKVGLLLSIPVRFYNAEDLDPNDPSLSGVVKIRINQEDGSVTLE